MAKALCVLVLLLSTGACGTKNASTTSPTQTPTTFTLSGQVMDSRTSSPVAGAMVAIGDGPNAGKSAATDGAGGFNFAGLEQSGFTVGVSAANYVSQSKGITLTSNQTLQFQLARMTFSVAGQVIDAVSSVPISGATVSLPDSPNSTKSAPTDSGGNYDIAEVISGTFPTTASAPGYQSLTMQANVSANTRVNFALMRTCVQPPGTPGFLGWTSAGQRSGSVLIMWDPAGGLVTSYLVEVRAVGDTGLTVIDTGNTGTSYTLTGLRTSVNLYQVVVRAKNPCGLSGPSNQANPRVA